jgi:hypothetical protein
VGLTSGVRTAAAVWLTAAGLLLAACQGDAPEQPAGEEQAAQGADEPDETGGAASSDDADPDPSDDAGPQNADEWAVPEAIDEDYVERVADVLLALEWELFLAVLEEGRDPGDPISGEVTDLAAQFLHSELVPPSTTINETLRATPEVIDPDGAPTRFTAEFLPTAEADCMSAHGAFEFRGLADPAFAPDPDETTAVVAMVPAPDEVDADVNPTGWVFKRVTNSSDDPPPDPCADRG